MINDIVKHFFRFLVLVLIQVVILNNVQLGGYINPYLYILFILMLPFDAPVGVVMISSLLIGLTIDMFLNTAGMHAAACVLVGYLRFYILKLFSPREGYEYGVQPTLQNLGLKWYLSYTVIMVLLHHLTLFYIEVFRFSEFFHTLLRALLSSIFSVALIITSQLLLYKSKGKK